MPRVESRNMYSAVFEAVAVSAAQDLFALTPSTRSVVVHRVEVGQDASETSEVLPIRLRRGIGATAGSGGSAVTPARLRPPGTGTAATCGVVRNNTTEATAGGGSLTTVLRRSFNAVTGFVSDPAPEQRIVVNPGETLVVNLPTAPGAALTMYGEIVFEEIG